MTIIRERERETKRLKYREIEWAWGGILKTDNTFMWIILGKKVSGLLKWGGLFDLEKKFSK